ncbi:MAG: MMPL family transporter [Hyphomicrobiales bacterium]|nr:MMPL family transporter [Hyphomicrobiales bacterium]
MFERTHIEKQIPALINWVDHHKLIIFIASAMLFIFGGRAMEHVKFDADVLVYFDHSMPERQALERMEAQFGRTNEIVYVLHGRYDGSMLERRRLDAIAWLQDRAESLPDAMATRSPLDLIPNGRANHGETQIEPLKAAIAKAGYSARSFISEDETVAAVAVIYPRSSQSDIDLEKVTTAARTLEAEFRERYPYLEIMMTGRLMMDRAFVLDSQDEIYGYALLQIGILALILLVAFRSLLAMFTLMAVVMISGPITMGTVGLMGFPLNGISSAASTVLLGLAVATGVHIIVAWQRALKDGLGRVEAVTRAMTVNAAPVTLSVVTTILSFLCLNFAASPPFGQLGNVVSLGLVFVFILCFTLLPALLLIIPAARAHETLGLAAVMRRLGCIVVRKSKALFVLLTVSAGTSVAGLAQITFDDTFSHYFDERFEVRRATDLFEEKLSGTIFVDFSIPVTTEGGPFGADHLGKLRRFSYWLAARPEFAETTSLNSVVGRLSSQNPALVNQQGLPASAKAEKTLESLYRAMLDDGLINLVDPAGRHSRVNVVLRGVSSADTMQFTKDAKERAEAIFGAPVDATGLPLLSAQLSIDSTHTMLISMFVALVGVSLLMFLALQNMKLGLISLLPNVLPAAAAMGVWGFFVGEVSFAATVVGALTFGIVVDDTVHLLMKYQAARDRGLGPQLAIHETMRSVGVAVVVTSVALTLSFAVFTFSGFLVNQHLGWLTALTLVAALIADLLFLPPLLLHAEKPASKRNATGSLLNRLKIRYARRLEW